MVEKLSLLNYLNLIGYIINTVVTFAAAPIFRFPDNAELSEKYQTLVTPRGWTFAIWGVIFAAQGIFTITQMLPTYRADPMVKSGVGCFYFLVCLAQSAWTFTFGYEKIIASVICMALILIFLLIIIMLQTRAPAENTLKEYWLLRFPFGVHCGWIIAAFLLNVNVVFVWQNSSANTQIGMAIASLSIVLGLAAVFLFAFNRPQYAIPAVLTWATTGIGVELLNPKNSIKFFFSSKWIDALMISAFSVSGVVGVGTLTLGIVKAATGQCKSGLQEGNFSA
jgi:hypothetical protein